MIRGIDSKQEQSARQLARDTRPLGTRIAEGISQPEVVFLTCAMCIVMTYFFPATADILAFTCLCLFIFATTRKHVLPFRIPKSAHIKDYNDPIPGSNKPKIGEGIAFFGNDRVTREELWFSNDDLRTHVLIFGSTGSGKTEALISIAFNSLIFASGFIYIDGKGDNSLFAKIFSMVRGMGREDDMLLINFMTGARDIIGPQKSRLSNTMNPFARGSSSMLSNLVTSIMSGGKQGGGGNDDMWTGRAINFVESLMKILTVMRDQGHILLDANVIRDYFILEKLETIVVDKRFPIDDTHSVPLDNLPKQVLEPLNAYMANLPGYNRQKKGNQGSEVREQHGFITMQLTRAFGSLADTYGHIVRTNLAEVDFKDVVLNRRIMVVLLPALEKSPQELANLGKIIIASLKAMMAAGLGEEVEGDYRDVVLRKPTNSPAPFVCIMDEYGYYAVEGFAVVPAQARSLGFSAIFAGQDLPAFQKASKEEAASIGANCNVKICMKLEDPQETWEYFNKVAGESYVTNVSGFQMDAGSLTMNYMDTRSASVDKRQRIDLLDLKDQRPGEAHIFFKSKIVRADMFFAAPKPAKKLRMNQFLKVVPPNEIQLTEMDKRFTRFRQVFTTPNYSLPEPPRAEDIEVLARTFQGAVNLRPFERGIAALIGILEHEVQKQRDLSVPYETAEEQNEMSAFTKIKASPVVLRMIGDENRELFSLPLIRRGNTTEELKHIERLCGKSEQEAVQISTSLIQDIEKATKFPPEVLFEPNVPGLIEDINDLIIMLGGQALGMGEMGGGIGGIGGMGGFDGAHPEFGEMPEMPDLSTLSKLEEEMETAEEVEEAKEHEESELHEEEELRFDEMGPVVTVDMGMEKDESEEAEEADMFDEEEELRFDEMGPEVTVNLGMEKADIEDAEFEEAGGFGEEGVDEDLEESDESEEDEVGENETQEENEQNEENIEEDATNIEEDESKDKSDNSDSDKESE